MSREKLIYKDYVLECSLNAPFEFSHESSLPNYLYTKNATYSVNWKSNKIVSVENDSDDSRSYDMVSRRVLSAKMMSN